MDDQTKKKFEELTSKWTKFDETKALSIKNNVSEYENTAFLSNLLKSFEDSFCSFLKEYEDIALSKCIENAYKNAYGSLGEQDKILLDKYLNHPQNDKKFQTRMKYLFKRCTMECINN
jgi:hypothetical protein